MPTSALIVIAVNTLSLLLALLVLSRNYKSKVSQSYFIFSLAVIAWSTSSVMGDHLGDFHTKLLFGKIAFAAGLIIPLAILLFAKTFPSRRTFTGYDKVLAVVVIAMASLCFTSLVITGAQPSSSGLDITDFPTGKLYPLFIAIFLIQVLKLMREFWLQYKSANRLGKAQLKFIAIGIVVGLIWGLIMNAILPPLEPSWQTVKLGPLATLILVATVGYAIVRHRLFDIRLVIVRSLAYSLSIAVLGIVYGVLTFAIVNRLAFENSRINLNQQITYTALAVVMAFLFQPLLNFFNKVTQKLFYKNAYQTQDVINQISSVIAGTISSNTIQKDALCILHKAVPTVFTAFLLFDNEGKLGRQRTIGERHIDKSDAVILQKLLADHGKKMIIYDELGNQNSHLQDSLNTLGVGIVVPLATRSELIGYLLVGDKKSGGAYNNQDIQLFAIAAKQLSVALQNTDRFEKIHDFNITLQNKIKDATKQLRNTNQQLVTMDEIKDDFINIASHQLRTPLTSVKGYIAMLLDGDFGSINKNQRQALQEAFTSSQRMVFLIADFLNLSRIKAGRFEIDAQATHLPQIVSEEVTQLRETANSRKLELEYNPPEKFPELMVDENKLRQVIMNMIDNAIYYTPQGGKVTVQLYMNGKDVIFKVKDTGIGVPKADQHKLFTKFYRAENAQRARPDGTGIGLFLAKKIIAAQGGAIIFESRENGGSTFGFSFPLDRIKVT